MNILPVSAALHDGASAGTSDAASTLVAPSNFLAQLSGEEFAALREIATAQHYDRNDFIFRSGSPGRNVYFLGDGKVKIHQSLPVGREVILWFCFAGEIFGLAEVARGGDRVVDAQACEPTEVLAVSQDNFRLLLVRHPRIAMLSMQVLSSRLRVLGEMFANLVADASTPASPSSSCA